MLRCRSLVHKEVDILQLVSGPLVVELHEVVEDEARWHVVTELFPGGELLQEVRGGLGEDGMGRGAGTQL